MTLMPVSSWSTRSNQFRHLHIYDANFVPCPCGAKIFHQNFRATHETWGITAIPPLPISVAIQSSGHAKFNIKVTCSQRGTAGVIVRPETLRHSPDLTSREPKFHELCATLIYPWAKEWCCPPPVAGNGQQLWYLQDPMMLSKSVRETLMRLNVPFDKARMDGTL